MKTTHATAAFLGLAISLLGIAVPAAGAEPGTLGVLPLVGDSIAVVVYRPSTGSHLDPNAKEALDVPPDSFDAAALAGVREASARTANEPVVLLPAAAMHVKTEHIVDADRLVPSPELTAALTQHHVTRLVVLTKRHAATHVQLSQTSVGSGELEGLGFYVDPIKRTRRGDTGERGTGFLAGFAYIDVTLIDVSTGAVLGHRAVEASSSVSGARSPTNTGPWGALDADQKIAMLRAMVRRQTAKAVVDLLEDTTPH